MPDDGFHPSSTGRRCSCDEGAQPWTLDPECPIHGRIEQAHDTEKLVGRDSPLWFQVSSLADWIECEFPDRGPNECLGRGDVEALREAGRQLRRVEQYRGALEKIVEAHGIPGFADRHRAANRKMKEIAHRVLEGGDEEGVARDLP